MEAFGDADADGFLVFPRGPYEGLSQAFSGPWADRCGVQAAIYGSRSGRGVENRHSGILGLVIFDWSLEAIGHDERAPWACFA